MSPERFVAGQVANCCFRLIGVANSFWWILPVRKVFFPPFICWGWLEMPRTCGIKDALICAWCCKGKPDKEYQAKHCLPLAPALSCHFSQLLTISHSSFILLPTPTPAQLPNSHNIPSLLDWEEAQSSRLGFILGHNSGSIHNGLTLTKFMTSVTASLHRQTGDKHSAGPRCSLDFHYPSTGTEQILIHFWTRSMLSELLHSFLETQEQNKNILHYPGLFSEQRVQVYSVFEALLYLFPECEIVSLK